MVAINPKCLWNDYLLFESHLFVFCVQILRCWNASDKYIFLWVRSWSFKDGGTFGVNTPRATLDFADHLTISEGGASKCLGWSVGMVYGLSLAVLYSKYFLAYNFSANTRPSLKTPRNGARNLEN